MKSINNLRLRILRSQYLGKPISPNSKLLREYKRLLPELTPLVKSRLIGLMLGDASLKWNSTLSGASLQFEWGDINKEYAFYIWHLLYPYCLGYPRRQTRINRRGNKVVTWCFQTITHSEFLFLHDIFISEGKKCVQLDRLRTWFNPVSMALWYMDDGGRQDYRGNGLQFHTQGFKVKEVQDLCTLLRALGLDCWVKYNKGKPIIAVSGHSYDKFIQLRGPYIHKSMWRKLPKSTSS